jgi:CheY-like chemotaxis protein
VTVRVLLADDEPGIRLVVSLNMRRRGWEVEAVADGLEALDAAAMGGHDVIVLDQLMPELTGIEVAERLGPGRTAPTLIYSAYLDEDVQRRADELGCPTVDKAAIPQLLDLIERLTADEG